VVVDVCDLLGGGDAANAIDIELGDIEGLEVSRKPWIVYSCSPPEMLTMLSALSSA
jgi:hypothetical protein